MALNKIYRIITLKEQLYGDMDLKAIDILDAQFTAAKTGAQKAKLWKEMLVQFEMNVYAYLKGAIHYSRNLGDFGIKNVTEIKLKESNGKYWISVKADDKAPNRDAEWVAKWNDTPINKADRNAAVAVAQRWAEQLGIEFND